MDSLDRFIAHVSIPGQFIYTVNVKTGALEVWTIDEYLHKGAFKVNILPHREPNAAAQQARNIEQRYLNRS